MDVRTANIILDITLILASLWMVYTVRDMGGVVGKTLNWIVTGTVILGVAHLFTTFSGDIFNEWNGTIHRMVVLVGFVVLVQGFRQLRAMR